MPSTDQSLLNAYLSFHGGYSSYSDFGTSPLKSEWGEGAVGGRMQFEGFGYTPSATIDVLASATGPEWLRAADPCAAYAGECADEGKGRFLAWTPGPDGEVWHVSVRDADVVGVRYAFDVPLRQRQVDTATEWSMINQELRPPGHRRHRDRQTNAEKACEMGRAPHGAPERTVEGTTRGPQPTCTTASGPSVASSVCLTLRKSQTTT